MNINRIDVTVRGRRCVGYQIEHEDGTCTETLSIVDPGECMSEARWALHLANLVEALSRRLRKEAEA